MALVEDNDPIRQRQSQANVVLDKEHREATGADGLDQPNKWPQTIGANASGRLVKKQNIGVAGQSTSNLEASQLADIELTCPASCDASRLLVLWPATPMFCFL